LKDIRAIVFLPPVPVLTPEEQKAKDEDDALSEWGFTAPDVQEWLKSQGINVNKGVNQ
jgi:hypothetical protein